MATPRLSSLRNLLLVHELAFLCLVIVTGALGAVWAYFWQQTSAETVRINRLIYEAQQIRSDLFRQIKEVTLARLMEDPDALSVYGPYSREIDQRFNLLRQRAQSRDEDLAIQEMQRTYRVIQLDMNKIFADPYLLNRVVRMKILDPSYEQALVGDFERAFDRLGALLESKNRALEERTARWIHFSRLLVPIPVLLAIGLLVFSRWRLQLGFVRPVRALMTGARLISEGRLEHRVPDTGVTEMAELARGLNHMAEELALSRDRLVESEKQAALGALVPVVAHNIRNPLATIRASAQLLEHADQPEETEEIKEAIISTVDRLVRWVSALVSYLHPLRPNPLRANATGMLDAGLTLLQSRLQDKGIRVVAEDWDRETLVEVDADLMEQALYGLLSNAIDASPPGGRLSVRAERRGPSFVMTIEDEGPGMPFKPEPNGLEPGPSTKRMGTGLGIPVAFKVVRAHGWTLSFGAGEAGGTRVAITAPIARAAHPSDVA